MPINHHEIIEDVEGHIRKHGGVWEEWYVGMAKDCRGTFSPIKGIGAGPAAPGGRSGR